MKTKLNKEWHNANKMAKNATLEQRVDWHLEHAKNCKCRPIPKKLKLEIEKRNM